MNCPHHTQIFASSALCIAIRRSAVRSDQRPSRRAFGALQGLSRVRMITKTTRTSSVRPEQVQEEALRIYQIIGTRSIVRLARSCRSGCRWGRGAPGKYLGTLEMWESAKSSFRSVLRHKGVSGRRSGRGRVLRTEDDFTSQRCADRSWQLATIQPDFNPPARFDLKQHRGRRSASSSGDAASRGARSGRALYVGADRTLRGCVPDVVIANARWWCRSPIVTTNTRSRLSKSLASVSLKIKCLAEVSAPKSMTCVSRCKEDPATHASEQKIPHMLVVGDREQAEGAAAVRLRPVRIRSAYRSIAIIARISAEIEQRADLPV